MPIELKCSGCSSLLHVPDTAAGGNARCPKCGTVIPIPAAAPSWEESPFKITPSKASPQFDHANPYAAPQASYESPSQPYSLGQIGNQQVNAGDVFNYAFSLWQANLGLLVGVFVVVMLISGATAGVFTAIQEVLHHNREHEMALAVAVMHNILGNVLSMFLGIGQIQIGLNLARGQRAEFNQLFSGGPRFWPTLGVSILSVLALWAGLLLCIVPGILLLLFYWPCFFLVIDNKARVMDSFGMARTITKGNGGTAFVLWLMSIGIALLGVMALCIGLIFAAPLVQLFWPVAYLMMSGQIPTRPTKGY